MRLLAGLIVAPQRGYDEPAILSYEISSFCPTSADGLHPPRPGGVSILGTRAPVVLAPGPRMLRSSPEQSSALLQCLLEGGTGENCTLSWGRCAGPSRFSTGCRQMR